MSERPTVTIDQWDYDQLKKIEADDKRVAKTIKRCGIAAAGVMVVIVGLWVVWALISPQITLYQANITKRAAIAEARAKADAAVELARADTERAKGTAEANRIIAETLTPEYLRWLYIDQLDQIKGQVIYVPTEAGLPILEAGKRSEEQQTP